MGAAWRMRGAGSGRRAGSEGVAHAPSGSPLSPQPPYLTHACGALAQSVVHKNRSQCSQPMGGVWASPLSSAPAPSASASASTAMAQTNAAAIATARSDPRTNPCLPLSRLSQ